jgi:hypothetical protein
MSTILSATTNVTDDQITTDDSLASNEWFVAFVSLAAVCVCLLAAIGVAVVMCRRKEGSSTMRAGSNEMESARWNNDDASSSNPVTRANAGTITPMRQTEPIYGRGPSEATNPQYSAPPSHYGGAPPITDSYDTLTLNQSNR